MTDENGQLTTEAEARRIRYWRNMGRHQDRHASAEQLLRFRDLGHQPFTVSHLHGLNGPQR